MAQLDEAGERDMGKLGGGIETLSVPLPPSRGSLQSQTFQAVEGFHSWLGVAMAGLAFQNHLLS